MKNWAVGKTELTQGLGTSASYSRKVVGFVPPNAEAKTNVNVVVSPVSISWHGTMKSLIRSFALIGGSGFQKHGYPGTDVGR